MTGHVPMRTCIGCRQIRGKAEMVRIVRTPEGRILADRTGKAAGRGAYVCADAGCLEKSLQRRALNRAFLCQVSGADLEQLREDLNRLISGAEAKV